MKVLIPLGHGYSRTGAYDSGATGHGTSEAKWLRGVFLDSLKKYADDSIEFYEQNLFGNREAKSISGYDEIVELHLDAVFASSVKGGHVIIYKDYKPDELDKRLGESIERHFGLRHGKMFSYRDDLYNLNTFARRGIPYRLLELGFITNKENMDYFRENYDEVARDIISDILGKQIELSVIEEAIIQVSKGENNMMKNGSKGANVMQLQKDLVSAGFDIGKYGADGSFGDDTEKAVKSFQDKYNLTLDGIAGPNTLSKLAEVLVKPKPSTTFKLGNKTYKIMEV